MQYIIRELHRQFHHEFDQVVLEEVEESQKTERRGQSQEQADKIYAGLEGPIVTVL